MLHRVRFRRPPPARSKARRPRVSTRPRERGGAPRFAARAAGCTRTRALLAPETPFQASCRYRRAGRGGLLSRLRDGPGGRPGSRAFLGARRGLALRRRSLERACREAQSSPASRRPRSGPEPTETPAQRLARSGRVGPLLSSAARNPGCRRGSPPGGWSCPHRSFRSRRRDRVPGRARAWRTSESRGGRRGRRSAGEADRHDQVQEVVSGALDKARAKRAD